MVTQQAQDVEELQFMEKDLQMKSIQAFNIQVQVFLVWLMQDLIQMDLK